jgi:choline dehydrogenase-like flavoprotein
MFFDARSLSKNETIETDVCIVGAGVAGLTLAREMSERKYKVCMLESGGMRPNKETQSLYVGDNIGQPYYSLDTCRARFFGGTSHYWRIPLGDEKLGVRLRPMDSIDFEERDWIPWSGWPFSKTDLDPYYERANSICKIGPYKYDVGEWEGNYSRPILAPSSKRIETVIFQFAERNLFYENSPELIKKAENINTFLHANVIEIETEEGSKTVRRLRAACLDGNRFWVSAKLFILAAGAIEVPRLLLLSNKFQNKGLGNQNDLLGRFFMEHPHLWSGYFIPADLNISNSTELYKIHRANDIPIMGKIALNSDVIKQEKLLNYCVSIHPDFALSYRQYIYAGSKGVDSLRTLRSAFRQKTFPEKLASHLSDVVTDISGIAKTAYRKVSKKFDYANHVTVYKLNHMAEQIPNPDSRVILSDKLDLFGKRRVQLDWKLSEIDILSIIRSQEIIAEEFEKYGIGNIKIEMQGAIPPSDIHGGWHHMGTTRMSRDPGKGVVDENCKVHGVSNLYIAGASVFPTVGYANPVLTTMALSIKLADHITCAMEN